ncbi:MAG TPA: dTDP-glucose 4,6-dehydratase [bacterium]|nr:dTDP-glucose 4,6-dehydratase [bacterium]
MKTLLVTGGSGFIGSHFIRRFHRARPDWKVINLDKLTYCGNRENTRLLEGNLRYEFARADICDQKAVDPLMARANAVMHFAAETHVDRSIESAEDFLMTNVFGSRVLIEAARRHKIKRFLHVSTDEVYGSLAGGSALESDPLEPSSPYSASKAASDLLARSYWKTYKQPVIITRCTNNYGPNQFPEKVIPLFVTNLLEGKTVPLYGSGQNQRDWIYVEDHCAALELVFDRGQDGEIYNIGAGNEISNLELTRTILKLMGADESSIRPVEDRLGHNFRYSVNIDKIKRLGFRPSVDWKEGLRKTIEWYTQHPEWWKPLKKDKFTVK